MKKELYYGKNTYTQENEFKNYEFSKGEELTDADLEVIASRSRKTYQEDKGYEDYMSEEYTSYIPQAELTRNELDFNGTRQFQIGNNLPSGE